MNKLDALQEVNKRAKVYADAGDSLEQARTGLYAAIRNAREARATQQEIADRTAVVVNGKDRAGLARQRIAQIIQETS